MRRETLLKALARVRNDIAESGVIEMFDSATEHARTNRESEEWLSFAVFRSLSVAYSAYTEHEKEVIRILELEPLFEPTFWSQLAEADPPILWEMRSTIRFAQKYVPRFAELITQENYIRSTSDDVPEELKGKELITFILVEEQDQYSSPARIVHLLDGITMMYAGFTELRGQRSEDLIVLACDSGSDKSFDILGIAAAIREMKEAILAAFNYRLLYRQQQMSATVSLIAQSLPVVREIDKMAEDGVLDKDKAEIIKNNIMRGTTKLLESGAITEEMEAESHHSPRALMRPEQRLLAAPIPLSANSAGSPQKSAEGARADPEISAEEIERMREILRQFGGETPKAKRAPSRRRRTKNRTSEK